MAEKQVGWTRPLGQNLENEIVRTMPVWREKMGKSQMKFVCPHKKVKDIIGSGGQEFVNALQRKLVNRNEPAEDKSNWVTVAKRYRIHGQEIQMKFNVFICSECGQEVHVPDITTSYAEYVDSMKFIFKALLDMLPSEMYFRSTYESNTIPSGNLLLAMLMSNTSDLSRFSRQQFGEYINDFADRYYHLSEELAKGGPVSAGEISASDFGSLAQISVADPLMYGAVYNTYTPVITKDSFMNELGGMGSQPTANQPAPVAQAQGGGVKIAK